MMRTGTSVVARILGLLGVHLGADAELLAPNAANPAGFWEHRQIIALNDELLARAGGSWHAPPVLVPGWEGDASLGDLRERARALIRSEFSSRPQWGWKDPRTCLTLPFWQSLVPALCYVVCLRNPVEAARSLAGLPWAQRRLSAPFEQGLDLWLGYTRRALEYTHRRRRLLLFYEDVLSDRQRQVSRLAAFIENERALGSSELERAFGALVQPSLRHQVAPAMTGCHSAERLYLELRHGSRLSE